MANWKEVVKGRIVMRDGGDPVKGATVQVWDKDLIINDYLGETKTDEKGDFLVQFSTEDFKDGVYEDRPDIFLIVRNPATGNKTKTKVYYDLEGELAKDDSEEVMDLGKVEDD